MFEDTVKFKGHIKVETIDLDGNIVDVFEDNNMIMDTARTNMCALVAGVSTSSMINKLVLGTQGHKTDNILAIKDASDGFLPERTELFSEESNDFTYPIEFTPPGTNTGACTITSEIDSGTSIDIVRSGTNVTYSIELPVETGNNSNAVIYTEAAFYAGDSIFSFKVFNAKVKDDTVILRITWKIAF